MITAASNRTYDHELYDLVARLDRACGRLDDESIEVNEWERICLRTVLADAANYIAALREQLHEKAIP
jgi:hypothetical protein